MPPKPTSKKTKSSSKKQNRKKTKPDSTTKVYFLEPSDLPCYANRRVVRSFRVDEGLWNELKPVLKVKYGSICRGIEVFGAAILHDNAEKVYISSTINPLTINQTVVRETNRARRKLEIDEEVVEKREVTVSCCGFCGKPLVLARFRHVKTGRLKDACDFHTEQLREREDWVEVQKAE